MQILQHIILSILLLSSIGCSGSDLSNEESSSSTQTEDNLTALDSNNSIETNNSTPISIDENTTADNLLENSEENNSTEMDNSTPEVDENSSSNSTLEEIDSNSSEIITESESESSEPETDKPAVEETPYINPFQPDTATIIDPDAPEYIPEVVERLFIADKEVRKLSGEISIDSILHSQYLWQIDGEVRVLEGTSVTIEAGTTLFGEDETSSLTFEDGSTLVAIGKKDSTIILTSKADVDGNRTEAGEWGGLTLKSSNTSVLKYLQILYSGKSRPSLQFIDESSDTVVEFVEIYLSKDSGIEISGGDVNIRNSIVVGATRDSLNLQSGWSGFAQNIFIEQRYEQLGTHSSAVQLDSSIHSAILSNLTVQSEVSGVGAGVYIEDGGILNLYNSYITGKRDEVCIEAESLYSHTLQSNIIGSCVGGSAKLIKIDSSINYISTGSIDWGEADNIEATDPKTFGEWFDSYNINYIGSYNTDNPNPWWKSWSKGVEN